MLDFSTWAEVPFHFWTVVLFMLGTIVGSFLNVCIHRMPREESIISPPSHCPHCRYSIPWFLNIPLVTWLWLRGKCANCGAPIAIRYFLVELLTGILFLSAWVAFGEQSPAVALAYCLVLAGFIVATFIDFEHFIIPDSITKGGMVVGFLISAVIPGLHHAANAKEALEQSALGMIIGAGVIYLFLRGGKLLFGKRRLKIPPNSTVVFGETSVKLPDQEIPYEEVFYRKTDCIEVQAMQVVLEEKRDGAAPEPAAPPPAEAAPSQTIAPTNPTEPPPTETPPATDTATPAIIPDGKRRFEQVRVRLFLDRLEIGEEVLNPEHVVQMEVVTNQVCLPQEAMGLGDVKFMGAIGAFLGWQAAVFSLFFSSIIGSVVSLALVIMKKRGWSSLIPYGPYIAMAATVWLFWGKKILGLLTPL